jgi:hypothetical protein
VNVWTENKEIVKLLYKRNNDKQLHI